MTKIVNGCIAYDLDVWPKNTFKNFKIKNYLFGATNIVTKSDEVKWVYSSYEIAFDRAGSLNFSIFGFFWIL